MLTYWLCVRAQLCRPHIFTVWMRFGPVVVRVCICQVATMINSGLGGCGGCLLPVFLFFWPKWVRTWCVGKIPGHLAPQMMYSHVPPSHTHLISSLLWTSTHIRIHAYPYVPICTLNKKVNFHICEITHISWILKNIGVQGDQIKRELVITELIWM